MRDDYYRILQVDPSAHPEVIRAAYRTLLRVLRKHPDLGGEAGETRAIVEAYATLGDAVRRRVYDLWLRAHAAPPGRPALPDAVAAWVRSALPGWHPAPDAPFAAKFDLVLRARGLAGSLLYLLAARLDDRTGWPSIFGLTRAVRLARGGRWPYHDAVLVVGASTDALGDFLREAARPRTRPAINRCALAACTFPPPRVHVEHLRRVPRVLRRLAAACP